MSRESRPQQPRVQDQAQPSSQPAPQSPAGPPPPPDAAQPRRAQSLRAELLLSLTVPASAALLLAVLIALAFGELATTPYGLFYLALLVVADILVVVLFAAAQIGRLVLRPLERVVRATEEVAGGDLSARVPSAGTSELRRLAEGINYMTDRLLHERSRLVHAEKLASVGRLAAGVGQEIGNPLGVIGGQTQQLRRRVGGKPAVDDALDAIDRESARIDRIVRALLDYARPRRGTPHRVDVNASIRRVVDLLREQGNLKQASVRLELDPAAVEIPGDRHDLEQALINLVLNAVDATGGSGQVAVVTRQGTLASFLKGNSKRVSDPSSAARAATRRVEGAAPAGALLTTADLTADALEIIVADSGPAIPESDAAHVFDPFYTTREPGQGTGLGLAIVARAVEGMGGTVWVRRAREGGAAFAAVFPLAGVLADLPAAPSEPAVARWTGGTALRGD